MWENGIIPVFKSTLGSDGLCCSKGTQTSGEIKKSTLGGVISAPHSLLAYNINDVSVLLFVFTFVPLVTDKWTTGKSNEVFVRLTEKRDTVTFFSMTNLLCNENNPIYHLKNSIFTRINVDGFIWHLRNRIGFTASLTYASSHVV